MSLIIFITASAVCYFVGYNHAGKTMNAKVKAVREEIVAGMKRISGGKCGQMS